jgi:acyl carrier protein
MIASYVHICDDDGRRTAPIVIGDRVWLAHGAVVEPGAVIGDGAVVAALAVVSGRVPAYGLVAATPTQILDLRGAPHRPEPQGGPAVRPSDGDGRDDSVLAEVRQAVIDWLDDHRCFGEAASRVTDDDMSLGLCGLLDSLGLVQIVTMLERRFGVVIQREPLARPERQSVRGLAESVLAGRSG